MAKSFFGYIAGKFTRCFQGGCLVALLIAAVICPPSAALAQIPPSAADVAAYTGLHRAAHSGDVDQIRKLLAADANLELRDGAGRTPLHVAAYASHEGALRALAQAGADMNAFEHQAYDIVTIAAVANDLELMDLALELGCKSTNITSPYIGTALIAAAHLGHHQVVQSLAKAGAPLDHVNNLDWTALIEAVILGDGGPDHIRTVEILLAAGADASIADAQGVTPLMHAKARGYGEIVQLLSRGG